MQQPHKSQDILKTDVGFLEFAGSLLFGLGLISLIMKLLCGLFALRWLCLPGFFPLPNLEHIFSHEFLAYAMPLSMVILGIGIGMFNRTGWFSAQFICIFYICFFGFSVALMGLQWSRFGDGFSHQVAFLLHLAILMWSMILMFYLFTSQTRQHYF